MLILPIRLQDQSKCQPLKSQIKAFAPSSEKQVLTAGTRWLEAVAGQVTPADGEDVPGEVLAPVVECSTPAIEHDENLISTHLSDGGGADQARVLSVHGFQLHAHFELVLQRLEWLLTNQNKSKN